MATRIVEGVPGGGKTYYMVYWLALKSGFCLELKGGGYVLDPSKKVRVVTNIAGLQIPHEDFKTVLAEAGGFSNFFTIEYQQNFSSGFHIIYILDEAQEWFHPQYGDKWDKKNLAFFTWARHEGHDLFFLTQNVSLLKREIVFLAEYIVQAQPRSHNVSKELTYKYRTVDGTETKIERLFFSKRVAALYKSMEKGETIKIKNYRARKVLYAAILAAVLMTYAFRSLYNRWGHYFGESSVPVSAVSSPSASPAPASASASASAPASAAPVGSSSLALPGGNQQAQQVEFYMYRLDHAVFKDGVRFLLGISWVPMKDFPYQLIKKGNNYFAQIPAVLLPALESGSRALPIRTNPKD